MNRKTTEMIYAILDEPSKNGKEALISKYKDDKEFDKVVRFLFNKQIPTGIKRKKLNTVLAKDITVPNEFETISDLIDYVSENNTGTEEVINKVIAFARAKGESEAHIDLIYGLICKDLKLGCSSSTYNKANKTNPILVHDVMAGKGWDYDRAARLINQGRKLYFTEKIDGNRGTKHISNGHIVSRNGLKINGLDEILEEISAVIPEDRLPDMELVYNDKTGKMTSQEVRSMTTSILNDDSITSKTEAGIIAKIFDVPLVSDFNKVDSGEEYWARRLGMDLVAGQIGKLGLKTIQIIPVEFTVSTIEKLDLVMIKLRELIDQGKEGLMCIADNQAYKCGKSFALMKLKNVISADLRITGWNEGKLASKWEGKFASFNVEFPYVDSSGHADTYTVAIGTGYSDEFREKVNQDPDSYIGKILEILITEVSVNRDGGYSFSYGRMVEVREDKDTISVDGYSLSNGYFEED